MFHFKDLALFPKSASTVSGTVDAIYFTWIGITVVVLTGIFGGIAYFSIKYREGSKADRTQIINSSFKIEAAWTIIPFIIAISIAIWAARVYLSMYVPPKDADEIYVVAKQWMWKFQHRGGQMEINTLHVPLGLPVKLLMTSQDVIHSLFVPSFRIKQDVLPGRYSSVWFAPTQVGEYHLFCTQYCGTLHSGMVGKVIVMLPKDYARWLTGAVAAPGAGSLSLASKGRELFTSKGCTTCHARGPGARGPNLDGLFGKQQVMESGENVLVDESYVRESILRPGAKVVQGYPNIMPTFQGQLDEEQILSLVEFIKTLGGRTHLYQQNTTQKGISR